MAPFHCHPRTLALTAVRGQKPNSVGCDSMCSPGLAVTRFSNKRYACDSVTCILRKGNGCVLVFIMCGLGNDFDSEVTVMNTALPV